MPKTLSDYQLEDMQELAKAFLLVSEVRYLVREAEVSYKEFFEQVDDICTAFNSHTLNDEANYIIKQLEETGRPTKSLERVFLVD
jgi:hypothetical protein